MMTLVFQHHSLLAGDRMVCLQGHAIEPDIRLLVIAIVPSFSLRYEVPRYSPRWWKKAAQSVLCVA